MSLAFVNGADGGFVNPGTSLAWNHDATGVTSPIVFVGYVGVQTGADAVTGITWVSGGVTDNFTQIGATVGSGAGNRLTALWYVIPRVIGVGAITISQASNFVEAFSVVYSNALNPQPSSITANKSTAGSTVGGGTTQTVTTDATKNNEWGIMYVYTGGGVVTAGAGAVKRYAATTDAGMSILDNNADTPVNTVISETFTNSGGSYSVVMTPFAPNPAAGGTLPFLGV